MKNFDSFDLEILPATRRKNGGLTGMSARLAVCFSGSESSTSNPQTSTNQQATGQASGAGSFSQVTGSGASSNTVVNVTNADASVATGAENVALNAIANNTTTTANALGFGAETTLAADQLSNNSLQSALGFGAEALTANQVQSESALNTLTNLSNLSASENAQINETSQLTVAGLANQLGQIVANTVPQSSAATQEILSGATPTQTATSGGVSNNLVNLAIVAGVVFTALAFFKSGGKST